MTLEEHSRGNPNAALVWPPILYTLWFTHLFTRTHARIINMKKDASLFIISYRFLLNKNEMMLIANVKWNAPEINCALLLTDTAS